MTSLRHAEDNWLKRPIQLHNLVAMAARFAVDNSFDRDDMIYVPAPGWNVLRQLAPFDCRYDLGGPDGPPPRMEACLGAFMVIRKKDWSPYIKMYLDLPIDGPERSAEGIER